MQAKERFLKYISFDTQSAEEKTFIPSTEKQRAHVGVFSPRILRIAPHQAATLSLGITPVRQGPALVMGLSH